MSIANVLLSIIASESVLFAEWKSEWRRFVDGRGIYQAVAMDSIGPDSSWEANVNAWSELELRLKRRPNASPAAVRNAEIGNKVARIPNGNECTERGMSGVKIVGTKCRAALGAAKLRKCVQVYENVRMLEKFADYL